MTNHIKTNNPNYFTLVEAKLKIGKRIRTQTEFSGVPIGTIGTVTGYHNYSKDQIGLDITWNIANRPIPLVDGFDKREYYQFLKECPGV
jgi:hypothetical protein